MTHSTSSISCSVALVLALTIGIADVARAQPAGDKAAAEAIFREGRELMDNGSFTRACPKFEKSLALYQSASVALNLARCYGKTNRLAAALTTLERAVELNRRTEDNARRGELDKLASEAKKEIEPRVPRVRVVVTPSVSGTVVQRDGIEVPSPLVGSALPVDAGTYEIRVAAPGYQEVVKSQAVGEGQTVVVEISLTRIGDLQSTALEPARPSNAPAEGPARSSVIWPWAVGGAGIAAFAVGIGFAVDYGLVRAEVDELCPGGTCSDRGADDADSLLARWDRDVALMAVGGGLGAALLVTAGIGLALDKGAQSAPQTLLVMPEVSPTFVGLAVGGTL